jgi:DNA-binding GntR family transcriptional regulator
MSSAIRPLGKVPSIRDAVEAALDEAIASGELESGVLVTAPNLAGRFGVSATPVREAMINLERRGLVESVPQKGFRVLGMGSAEVQQILQIRGWLEAPAMALVARSASREQLEAMRPVADETVSAARESDLAHFVAVDNAFHLGLAALTGSPRLVELIAELRGRMRLVGLSGMSGTDELVASAEDHHVLLDLLLAGDAEGADLFTRRHIGDVVGWWSGRGTG